MKYYRQTKYLLLFLFIVNLGVLSYFIYQSGVNNQVENRKRAEQRLKDISELWVNREFDKLGMPFSSSGRVGYRTKRSMTSADGTIEVDVDSAKERMCMFSPELGERTLILYAFDHLFLDSLNNCWQRSLGHGLEKYHCVLTARIAKLWDKKDTLLVGGDSTLCAPRNLLCTYYLDDLYLIEAKAYLKVPSFVVCVDWRRLDILNSIIIGLLLLGGLVYVLNSNKNGRYETRDSDDLIYQISEDSYQIGEAVFEEKTGTFTCLDYSSVYSPQPHKLLIAFVQAPQHFLSNDDIAGICSWSVDDAGINERRRSAIKLLRKQLQSGESHVYVEHVKEKNGYRMFVANE
ncbi:MAG: hypothetical protein LKI39_08335 [Bacteroides sp.]|jgi:DNA-binding winged helix-turn-helix (wHTH) protein|nr:hypothetical protein [Bacteroides sp.]